MTETGHGSLVWIQHLSLLMPCPGVVKYGRHRRTKILWPAMARAGSVRRAPEQPDSIRLYPDVLRMVARIPFRMRSRILDSSSTLRSTRCQLIAILRGFMAGGPSRSILKPLRVQPQIPNSCNRFGIHPGRSFSCRHRSAGGSIPHWH